MDSELRHLITLARSGEHSSVLLGLRAYLEAHPDEANAWALLGGLAPDPRVRAAALRRALELDPTHVAAQQGLTTLQAASVLQELVAPIAVEHASPFESSPPLADSVVSEQPPSPPEVSFSSSPDLALPELALPVSESEDSALAVRQARALVWPFRPRGAADTPLGTLLDEGRVTRQDLMWALEHARESEVRQAAQDLLAFDHRLPDTAMTVEDARLTAWPFRRLNQSLGALVEAGTVTEKDLRRAAWFAGDARVREAARLLLPTAMARRRKRAKKPKSTTLSEKERTLTSSSAAQSDDRNAQYVQGGARYQPSPARPMPIIEGADYLVQQIRRRRMTHLVLLAVGALLLLIVFGVLAYGVGRGLLHLGSLQLWFAAPLLLSLALLLWLWQYIHELLEELRYFQQGQQGEIMAARLLRQGLNGLWILFRNVRLPGQHEDIDLVLLGPPGIFAVEVKAYSGHYAYRGQFWFQRAVVGWHRLRRNPGKQARANAGQLHAYIAHTLGRDIWVEPRVLWAGSGKLDLRQPEVYVWMLGRLSEETERLRNLPGQVTEEDWAAITGLLKGLCSTLQD